MLRLKKKKQQQQREQLGTGITDGGFGDSEGPKGKNTEPTEEQNETARETETETAKEKERAGESYDLDCLMLG